MLVANKCFRRFEGNQLEGFEQLIAQFIRSDSFLENYFHLVMALERTTAKLPVITLLACERFIDVAGVAASDIRTSEAGHADSVTALILRTYQQSSDDTIRSKSLDLVDKLMELGAYGINAALEKFER